MEDTLKRNIVKVGFFSALAWVAYKVVKGVSKNESPEKVIKEVVAPVDKVATEVKKVTKRFLKGSPEAKAYMAKIRSMPRKVKAITGKKKNNSKAEAGKKGGNATADLGKHKGHSTKRGLSQDQKKTSKEKHEKNYRKSKGK